MSRAVVFAYHNVGVRCLKTLLAAGMEVALIVTHQDNPAEAIWFDSVLALAQEYGIEAITPDDPNDGPTLARIQALAPDFLFSFYYRKMLSAELLATAQRGAYNLHGSLLPKYRGRVPINWAIIHGERETGATLHVMNAKPDNGAIVDQCAVPILPDDTAAEVFDKVVVAAEIVLWRSLPALMAGTARLSPQDLSQGAYFGGRCPEDGRIDPHLSAVALHNFVRALSRPYPGAFFDLPAGRVILWKTRLLKAANPQAVLSTARLSVQNDQLCLTTADGGCLLILDADLHGVALDVATFSKHFGAQATISVN